MAPQSRPSHWRDRLRHAWTHRGWLARLLWPVSWIYGALVRRRLDDYASGRRVTTRLSVPVVVVGNVVAGGAGKTPIVLAIVQHGMQSGWKIGVVSRGYGRRLNDVRAVSPESSAAEVGDEPLLIARVTAAPVWVGPDRVAAAQALLAQHPDLHLIVSDDGLQHWALGRDLELCVFDERGTGNGWLLPAGPLREPWPRPHPRASCMELETSDTDRAADLPLHPSRLIVRRQLANYAYRADGTRRALCHWQSQPVCALAGIAKPERFFNALMAQGLSLRQCIALPDHHDMQDVKLPLHWHNGVTEDVLCTEKDAVKLWPQHPHVWAVPLQVDLPRELRDRIDALIVASAKSGQRARS